MRTHRYTSGSNPRRLLGKTAVVMVALLLLIGFTFVDQAQGLWSESLTVNLTLLPSQDDPGNEGDDDTDSGDGDDDDDDTGSGAGDDSDSADGEDGVSGTADGSGTGDDDTGTGDGPGTGDGQDDDE